tara:strand:+ start:1622 stop:1972 length:351 start_codon:yes stop_codon:yes gene_type:complete
MSNDYKPENQRIGNLFENSEHELLHRYFIETDNEAHKEDYDWRRKELMQLAQRHSWMRTQRNLHGILSLTTCRFLWWHRNASPDRFLWNWLSLSQGRGRLTEVPADEILKSMPVQD